MVQDVHANPTFELIQFLVRSDDRVSVLAALTADAAATRSALQQQTGIPRSTVSRILHELEDRALVSSADRRYEVTPFGAFLADRLRSAFTAIDAMQRLQTLLDELSDTEPDLAFTDHTSSEVLTPTSADTGAPSRRFADLLHAASRVRLLGPAAVPVLVTVDSALGDGVETFDAVIPRAALEPGEDAPLASGRLRDLIASGDVSLFAYDGDIPYFAGTVDEVAVVGLAGDAGPVRAYIETSDERVRCWTEAVLGAYRRASVHVTAEDLTA